MRSIRLGENHTIGLATVITVACLLLLGIVGIFQASAIRNQLNDWKLLPQPERLTELYFEDHAKLATTYIPDTPQQFRFTVHNLEYRATEYSYSVVGQAEDGSTSQELASGAFALNQNGYKTTNVQNAPPDLGRRVKIVTTLTFRNEENKVETQTIHYWVTRT